MPYDNLISRTDASALIPEDVANEVWSRVAERSAVMSMFRRIPVAQTQLRIPIISALPTAYWVNGDTGLKQTSELQWANKFLNIEELASIVPIPENVLDDTNYDVWGEARPLLEEAVGRALDAAVFFGTNAPASFPTNIAAAATSAGNEFTAVATQAQGGYPADIDATMALLELDGYDGSGIVAARSVKAKLRAARAADGQRHTDINTSGTSYLDQQVMYPMRGLFPSDTDLFLGDWSNFVLGVRKDMTYKMLDQAVLQDPAGNIVYNLPQQDMVALRLTFRAGWQVANVINYDQPVEANRYPVAVLRNS